MGRSSKSSQCEIVSLSDRLMEGYAVPPISASHLILTPDAWEFIADIDALQAGMAGSRTWETTVAGREIRVRLAEASRDMADRAQSIQLGTVARKLMKIAIELEAFPTTRHGRRTGIAIGRRRIPR